MFGAVALALVPMMVKAQVQDGPPERLVLTEAGGEVADGMGLYQVASRDGSVVAFVPFAAPRLVGFPQQLTEFNAQVLVVDRNAGTIELASRTPTGGFQINTNRSPGNLSISDDGRYVVFSSSARNLDPAASSPGYFTYLYDRANRTVRAIDSGQPFGGGLGVIDGTGRFVIMICRGPAGIPLNDPEAALCQRDISSGAVRVVRRGFLPSQQFGFKLSRDGQWLAVAYAGPLLTTGTPNPDQVVHIYAVEVATGATELVSAAADGTPGNFTSGIDGFFSISDDGDFIAFVTAASNLLPTVGPPGAIVVKQRSTGIYRRASSLAPNGAPVLSGDGRRLIYIDYGFADIARIYDWETNTSRPAVGAPNGAPNASLCDARLIFNSPRGDLQQLVAISGDGRTIVFPSLASNLVPSDVPNTCDLFVRQLGPVPQPATPVHGPNRVWLAVLALLMGLAAIIAVRRIG
jgi:Tol biopolymer transport system component